MRTGVSPRSISGKGFLNFRSRGIVLGLIALRGSVTIAELRDRLNLSRKYAQAVLEYFDKTGLTKRVEDRHVLNKKP